MTPIPAEPGHWLFGNAKAFARAQHRFPADVGRKHGGLAQCRALHKRFLVTTNPHLAQQVLVTHQDRYVRSFHFRAHELIIGKGLLSTDGREWLTRRRTALPAFRSEHLRRIVPNVRAATVGLFERWESLDRNGKPVPIVADMQHLAMSVIAQSLLSADIVGAEATRFGQAVGESSRLVSERYMSPVAVPLFVPTRRNRYLRKTRDVINAFVARHLDARQHAGVGDMLDALKNARDPETGQGFSPAALLDEIKTLFVAGFETTAAALAWMLYLLARHPEVAERWHEEIDRVLNGAEPAWEHLEKLKWTRQVVTEALRLYPPVYTTPRECVADDAFDGHVIPAGMLILISIFGIHRSPELWPDPDAFKPERFDEGRPWARHAYLPFGLGKHTCIGNTFALVEMTIILAMIGQRFRLTLIDRDEIPESPKITLVPSREIPLGLVSRAREKGRR